MSTYCTVAPGHPLHGPYHDLEYGVPVEDEAVLFERLSLEIFQAGLSWLIVLKRRPALNAAFDGFDVDRVAAYGRRQMSRLLGDAAIIRNRRKIESVVENARRIAGLRASHSGFAGWLGSNHPLSHADWTRLFRATFVFTGPEVVREFLLSIGYLPGAHAEDCPAYRRVARLSPPWMLVAGSKT